MKGDAASALLTEVLAWELWETIQEVWPICGVYTVRKPPGHVQRDHVATPAQRASWEFQSQLSEAIDPILSDD